MPPGLKTLIVVLFFSSLTFWITKPICLRFIAEKDWARRRLVWFVLTTVAFLSPSFWPYAAVAIPLLIWSVNKDEHPASLYLMFFYVIPSMNIFIPMVGINQLFDLNQFRLLSLFVLIPVAIRLFKAQETNGNSKFTLMDGLLLSFSALQIALYLPYESPTNTARRTFVLFLDTVVVYYVFSRLAPSRRAIVDAIATYCLVCAILAPLAVFETLKMWLLYEGIGDRWGAPNVFAFLMRGDSLRAQVSTGHSLGLGCVMAVGFGFWLYLKDHFTDRRIQWLGVGAMWAGMLAAYSRAPWITAVLIFFCYLPLSPGGMSKLLKATVYCVLASAAVLMSPLGDRVIDNLPFVGNVDSSNVVYRQELMRVSWELVQQNPFFGDQFALLAMESLRQGQGIIDLVNAYASVAVFQGLVGLSLFCGLFLAACWQCVAAKRRADKMLGDADLAALGATIAACLVGILFFIGTAGLAAMLFPLTGLAASYAALVSSDVRSRARSAAQRQWQVPRSGLAGGHGKRQHAR